MAMTWIGTTGVRYSDFVWQAVTNSVVFQNFRRDPVYRVILEHVSKETGEAYLRAIDNSVIRNLCFASEYADTIGSPEVATFENRQLSPTTLRYGKVLKDLLNYFPGFGDFTSIIEIGIGYGGQARLICEFSAATTAKVSTYTLVDLLPVINLARLYLEHFTIKPLLVFDTRSTVRRSGNWDLVISNYAFSEFSRELQEQYLEVVLEKSASGYLTMNTGLGSSEGWGDAASCLTVSELMRVLPNAVLRREEPQTGTAEKQNYVLVYGAHNTHSNLNETDLYRV